MWEREDLYCPICKKKLEIDGTFIYEDICNTDIRSDKYICINKECGLYKKSFWNDSGEYFCGELGLFEFEKKFGHTKYAAFNSISKNSEVEIYKKGLKKKTMLSPALTLWWLKPYIEHNYKADNWGNILKRSYKLKFLKKEKDADDYYIHYISGVRMFFFSINYFKSNKYKPYKKTPNEYNIKEIYKEIYDTWDKRFYKKVVKKYLKIRYFFILDDINEKYTFYEKLNEYKYNKITKKEYDILLNICPKDIDLIHKLTSIGAKGKYLDKMIRKEKILSII
jgi:hypothetical protein